MSTTAKREAVKAIRAWLRKRKIGAVSIRHVMPRAYVVARVAPKCLLVSRPWMDAEPQVRDSTREHPVRSVYLFDDSLAPGDWCMTAYVNTATSGETVAIPHRFIS